MDCHGEPVSNEALRGDGKILDSSLTQSCYKLKVCEFQINVVFSLERIAPIFIAKLTERFKVLPTEKNRFKLIFRKARKLAI